MRPRFVVIDFHVEVAQQHVIKWLSVNFNLSASMIASAFPLPPSDINNLFHKLILPTLGEKS